MVRLMPNWKIWMPPLKMAMPHMLTGVRCEDLLTRPRKMLLFYLKIPYTSHLSIAVNQSQQMLVVLIVGTN